MKRVILLAVILLSAGCSSFEKPSWFPKTNFYTDDAPTFFGNNNEEHLPKQ